MTPLSGCLSDYEIRAVAANHGGAESSVGDCTEELVIACRRFRSSKMCSVCGRITDLPLSEREWTCECGAVHDRNINGAKNLRCHALARVS